ncbi:MAG: ParA family protein [Symploca sp. SIO1C2]|nr:ParA family protein [Symploca sp. SIO1C2]
MAKKVSIINMKGGVGKSTLTVNLAWYFAAIIGWDKKVLVVDLDPQFNASQYLIGVSDYRRILEEEKPTTWDILEQNIRSPKGQNIIEEINAPIYNVITFNDGCKVDLIPSRLELSFSLRNPAMKEKKLAKFLSKLENEYDLILIDCAPTESVLTTAAYLASDYVLVPVKPEYLSAIGLNLLVTSMNDFKNENEEHNLILAGVVFNMTSDYLPEETYSKDTVRLIAQKNGWYVFNAEVPYSRSFPKGARLGKPIFKTSKARTEKKFKFFEFANEFAERINLWKIK